MSLEVHIYGPGFGETIFLRWPKKGGGWQGALVDAHCHDDGKWLASKLNQLELTELEFVVATHPHLDHINNLAAGLELAKTRVMRAFYWPPFSDSSWIRFFDRLAAQQGGELPQTAEMIRQWFGYLDEQFETRQLVSRCLEGRSDFRAAYRSEVQGVPLVVKVIGPWDAINSRLAINVAGSRRRGGRIDYKHRYANDVSIALLIEYGDAQIVLGGDMEAVNWKALQREANGPKFQPSLVKVSHHGSENGRIDRMWPRRAGFFEGKSDKPIAVVTPWRQASGELPKGDTILREIRDAGFTVYVTGEGSTPRYRITESHVSIRVNPDRTTEVLNQFKVRTV